MTPPSFACVLDSGHLFGGYVSREQAQERAATLNAESAGGRARGDLVTLRRIVGIVVIRHKPPRQLSPPPRRKRKVRARPKEMTNG